VSETGAAARINEGTNEMQTTYGFGKTVTHDFATAVARVTEELGKLVVFCGVRDYPARVKCATLAWHTLKSALTADGETVTTE
jgi:NifU-like protein involved in Fe-S cluster formation